MPHAPLVGALAVVFLLCGAPTAVAQPPPTDNGRWTPLPEVPTARDGAVAVVVGAAAAYVIGGSNNHTHLAVGGLTTAEKFDLQRHVWEGLPPMPTPRSNAAGAAIGDMVYVAGGLFHNLVVGALEMYNTTSNYWSQGPPLPQPRCCLAAAAAGGELWAIGGGDLQARSGAVEIYSPLRNAWRSGPALPDARAYHAAAVYGGRLIVVGGQHQYDLPSFILTLDLARPDAGWQPHAGDATVAAQAFGAAAAGSVLYLVGGLPRDSLEPTGQVAALRLDTLAWGRGTPLPAPRDSAAAVAAAGALYVFGGFGPTHEAGAVVSQAEYLGLVPPAGDAGAGAADDRGWGWRFLFWFTGAVASYCAAGCVWNVCLGRGGGPVPHAGFWAELPLLCLDGVVFSVQGVRAVCSLRRRPADRTPDPPEDDFAPSPIPRGSLEVPRSAFMAADGTNYRTL